MDYARTFLVTRTTSQQFGTVFSNYTTTYIISITEFTEL